MLLFVQPVPSLEREIPNLCEPFPGLIARSSITFRPLSVRDGTLFYSEILLGMLPLF